MYDPQAFHTDPEAAKATVYGGLIASGLQTIALTFKLFFETGTIGASSLGSPGLESLKWTKPVYPGDVLSLRHRVVDRRPMASRPHVGLVRTVWEMHNQHGEQVLHMEGWGMFRRRRPAETSSGED